MQPATIKLFLVNGSPTGLRTAEISNWTGLATAGPRSDLESLLKREQLEKPGIYFLTGIEADTDEPVLYIGESENVAKRLKQHSKNEAKDYWTHASAFVSKDDNLTKAHIRYIEDRMIDLARASKRVKVMNGATSGSSLPEADRAEMDIYIERMIQLLPVLGIHYFSTPVIANPVKTQSDTAVVASLTEATTSPSQILFCKVKGLVAQGQRSETGFTIFESSELVKEVRSSCPASVIKLREQLFEKGVIVAEDERFIFTQNYEFPSPSTAGAIVSGGSTNGLVAWTNEQGVTLKEIEG